MKTTNEKIIPQRGAVLLIAILVASVALAVGLGVYNRTYKELLFASYWKQTQTAFSAADSGLECAMWWDQNPAGGFPTGSGGGTNPVTCFGQTNIIWSSVSSGGVATSTFSAPVSNGCAVVTVVKTDIGGNNLHNLTFQKIVDNGMLSPSGIISTSTAVYTANADLATPGTVSQFTRVASGDLTPMTPATVDTITATGPAISADAITISSDGKSVYVASYSDNSISEYQVNANGTLAPNGYVYPVQSPYGLATSPDGKSVYVSGASSNIYWYSRNTGTGVLSSKSSTASLGVGYPTDVTVSPDGTSVYSVDDGGYISEYKRAADGSLFLNNGSIQASVNALTSIAVSHDGLSVFVVDFTGEAIYQFNRAGNGVLTPMATLSVPTGLSPHGIVISPDDAAVYVANTAGSNVSQYSRATTTPSLGLTPMAQPTASTGASTNPSGITISPDGKSVYTANTGSTNISQLRVGGATATLIEARGYNTPYNAGNCNNISPRRVERGLKVSY